MQATQVDFPQATRKERKRASDWGGCATYARKMDDTFDGRNPAPVDMVNVPLFTGFYTSQVVQEFFHQQYGRFANKWLPCQIPQSFCIFLEGFGYDLTLSRNVAIPIFPESVQRRKVLYPSYSSFLASDVDWSLLERFCLEFVQAFSPRVGKRGFDQRHVEPRHFRLQCRNLERFIEAKKTSDLPGVPRCVILNFLVAVWPEIYMILPLKTGRRNSKFTPPFIGILPGSKLPPPDRSSIDLVRP